MGKVIDKSGLFDQRQMENLLRRHRHADDAAWDEALCEYRQRRACPSSAFTLKVTQLPPSPEFARMDEHLAKRRRERMRAIIDDAIRRVTAAGERIAREKRERKIVPVTFTPKPVKRKRGRPRKAKVHQFVNGDEE